MALNFSKFRKSTLLYLGLVIAGSLGSQTLWVRNHIIPIVDRHPHLAFLGPAILTALTLLHNPEVAQLITSLQQEETQQLPDGTVKTSSLSAQTTEIPAPNPKPAQE